MEAITVAVDELGHFRAADLLVAVQDEADRAGTFVLVEGALLL